METSARPVVPHRFSRTLDALIAFVRLGRPKFLAGGLVFYGVGAAAGARRAGRMDWIAFALGQAITTAVQLMTHYANDYYDLEADRANRTPTAWSGGSRVLPDGELSPHIALRASLVFMVVALGGTAAVAWHNGAWALLLLGGATSLAWAYSAPPLRLCARGLGELDTALVMTLLLPLAGFWLQTGRLEAVALAPLLPLCLLQFAMLLAVEFPDRIGDHATGKRNLVVRWGPSAASRCYAGALALVYAPLPIWVAWGLPRTAVWGLVLGLPLAAWLVRKAAEGASLEAARDRGTLPDAEGERDPLRIHAEVAFGTVALLFGSAAVELIVFAWL